MSTAKVDDGGFPLSSEATESVFRSVTEAEVSLDEMLSLACRQGKQDIVELLLESGANVNHRNKAGNTPLLEACSQGHVTIAKLLLDRNADIDAPTETTFDSALTWACTLGNIEIVTLLLDRKANVEHRTKDGCTALMFAALAGHEKVARLLLDHKAEINVESDSNKDSPLTFACWKGHQKVVKLFLERSANIEHRTKEGFSPLMFAALGGHTQVADLLLKHKAEVNTPSGSNNDIPLTSACWKGHHHVVQLLLRHHSDIEHRTKDGCTPLMLAAREGHLSVAKLLLDHNGKVNVPSGSENNIPLTLACWKGHRDVVELLLDHASNIEHQNKAGCTPLMLAAREGHLEATQLLLDSGALIDVPSGSNDDTPLTLACWKGHEEVVQLLIERHSSVNHQTKTGCTPLMEATREGHVGVARLLLEAGADVETPDNYGQSPFFMACWKGHAEVAALLLEYDANKDCRTKTGITPLFQACRENHVDVVKLLLDYGCNPSTPFPNSRECPLTLAAEKGYTELAQLLLSRNANVEARTKKGCSPFYLACKEGFEEIAIMLAKHGASTEAPDQRGTTPLLAAFKNGNLDVVEWLLGHVAHLPSDSECQKALTSLMPPETDLFTDRSKCLELIMKAKKAREQAALKNAQILFEEIDAEREKKRKAAAKKRNKRKERKKKEQVEKIESSQCGDEEEEETPLEQDQYPVDSRPSSEECVADDTPVPDYTAVPSSPTINIKKKTGRKKKKKIMSLSVPTKESNPINLAPPPPGPGDLSDSADSEGFHDAHSELPGVHSSDQQTFSSKPGWQVITSSSSQESVPSALTKATIASAPNPPLSVQSSKPATPVSSITVSRPARQDKSREKVGSSSDKSKQSQEKEKKVGKNHSSKGQVKADSQVKRSSPAGSSAPKASPSTVSTVSSSVTTSHAHSGSPTTSDDRPASDHVPATKGRNSSRGEARKTVTKNDINKIAQSKQDSSYPPATSVQDWNKSVSPVPSNQSVYEGRVTSPDKALIVEEENLWNLSYRQNDWESEGIEDDQLFLSKYITDDDKIRAAQMYTPTTHPTSTAALPTPSTHSTVSYSTPGTGSPVLVCTPSTQTALTSVTMTTPTASNSVTTTTQCWHEVTRPTRTVLLNVSNSLVGRIIGRGGSKINTIQEVSGAHINVSRNTPKSVDRIITIRGTQKSITKAKELIDEALSSPDNPLLSTTPSPVPSLDSDAKLSPPLPTALSSQGPKKKHPQAVLSHSTTPPLSTRTPSNTTTISEPSHYLTTDVSRRIHSTIEDREGSAVEKPTAMDKANKTNPWSRGVENGDSFATVAATLGTISPTLWREIKAPPPRPSSTDSSMSSRTDRREVCSGSGNALNVENDLELNANFPPLPKHARSMSDSQVLASEERDSIQEDEGVVIETQSLTLQKSPLSKRVPCDPVSSPTMSSNDLHTSKQKESVSIDLQTTVASNKLPYSLPSPAADGEEVVIVQEVVKDRIPFRQSSKSDGQVIGLLRIRDKSAGDQHRMSLPANSLPASSLGAPTLDASSDLPLTRGNYGAIGPPPRKHSVPASLTGHKSPTRKLSHAGLHFRQFPTSLEHVSESNSIPGPPLVPPTFTPPSSAPHSKLEAPWFTPNRESSPTRGRSVSWAGQHQFHSSTNGPPFQPPQGPFIPRPPTYGSPYVPVSSPGTPHGDNHSTAVQHGIYGPVGSNMPHVSKPHPLPNSHTPPPNAHLGDMWIQHVGGPIGSHGHPKTIHFPPRPPSFPPQAQSFYPSIGYNPGPPPLMIPSDAGHTPKPVVTQMGAGGGGRHWTGHEEQSPHLPAHLHHWEGNHKRWSVPGFSSAHHPALPLHQAWGQQQAAGRGMNPGAGFFPDQPFTDDGGRSQLLTGGSSLSLNDAWGPSWSNLPATKPPVNSRETPPHQSPPTSSLPPMSASFSTKSASSMSKGEVSSSSEAWLSRSHDSIAVLVDQTTREDQSASAEDQSTKGGDQSARSGDLQRLLKSLDISNEHAHALKARKLSLQQLHSMSDEEWRGLKLPVGPRVKLMNAVSNISLPGEEGGGDEDHGKGSDLSADQSASPQHTQVPRTTQPNSLATPSKDHISTPLHMNSETFS